MILTDALINKGKTALWRIVRFALLFGLGFILLYPMLFMLSNAFKPVAENYDPSIIWIPKTLTLDNFIDAINVMNFGTSLFNTLYINIITAFIQMGSCLLAGYGFARFRFKYRGIVFAMVIMTIIVPPQVMSVPMYINFVNLKMIDSVFAFYIPAMLGQGLKSGLYIFVFRQFFRGLPMELDDAATVDGCGIFKIFTHIMLPNARSAVLTVFLFSVVWQYSDFFNPAMYMDKSTVATALYSFRNAMQNLPGVGTNVWDPFFISTRIQAACLLSVTPLLVMYAFTQRFFVEGIERTGIVG
jgi:multiple sugar transport system permease protein